MNAFDVNSSGTVGFWTFENQLMDSSGAGLSLIPVGTVPYVENGPPGGRYSVGPFSNSGYFSGVFQKPSSNKISLEFDYMSISETRDDISGFGSGTKHSMSCFTQTSPKRIAYYTEDNGGSLTLTSTVPMIQNNWYHVCITDDKINGLISVTVNETSDTVGYTPSSLYPWLIRFIGHHLDNPLFTGGGYIKNFRISNYIKTLDDIKRGSPGVIQI